MVRDFALAERDKPSTYFQMSYMTEHRGKRRFGPEHIVATYETSSLSCEQTLDHRSNRPEQASGFTSIRPLAADCQNRAVDRYPKQIIRHCRCL